VALGMFRTPNGEIAILLNCIRGKGVTSPVDEKSAPLMVDVLNSFKVERVVNNNGKPKLVQR